MSDIESIENELIYEPQKMVSLLYISHQPGSGATTICKHALWKIKQKMRCAVVNGSAFHNSGSNRQVTVYKL